MYKFFVNSYENYFGMWCLVNFKKIKRRIILLFFDNLILIFYKLYEMELSFISFMWNNKLGKSEKERNTRLKGEVMQFLLNRKKKGIYWTYFTFNHEPSVTFKRYSIHGMWETWAGFEKYFKNRGKLILEEGNSTSWGWFKRNLMKSEIGDVRMAFWYFSIL